jgi:hypothetical protein
MDDIQGKSRRLAPPCETSNAHFRDSSGIISVRDRQYFNAW